MADFLGRVGIGTDLSFGYCMLASWRCQVGQDVPSVRAVPRHEGQASLFEALS